MLGKSEKMVLNRMFIVGEKRGSISLKENAQRGAA
jgi:hypothetical protein